MKANNNFGNPHAGKKGVSHANPHSKGSGSQKRSGPKNVSRSMADKKRNKC